MPERDNKEFELRGVNHLALVCEDMARTVDFYSNVLGMPLTKTIELPGGMGQHFFFDMGNGDSLAFFWFPDSPDRAPGVASPAAMVGAGSIATAHGSMNHIAFDVDAEKMEEYRERLAAKGIEVTEIVNHDNSPLQQSPTLTDDVFVRSMYFFDPDGVMYPLSKIRPRDITDGLSHTVIVAETREERVAVWTDGGTSAIAAKVYDNANAPTYAAPEDPLNYTPYFEYPKIDMEYGASMQPRGNPVFADSWVIGATGGASKVIPQGIDYSRTPCCAAHAGMSGSGTGVLFAGVVGVPLLLLGVLVGFDALARAVGGDKTRGIL